MKQVFNAAGKGSKWEWRVFWPEGVDPPAHFERYSEGKSGNLVVEQNADIYFLMPNNHVNLKLRDSELAHKTIATKTRKMTEYQKKHSATFPMSPKTFKELTGIKVGKDIPSTMAFVTAIMVHEPGTRVVHVGKERRTLKGEGDAKMNAEFSELRINGRKYKTFCLESRDKGALKEAVEKLDIGLGMEMDYIDFLRKAVDQPSPQGSRIGKAYEAPKQEHMPAVSPEFSDLVNTSGPDLWHRNTGPTFKR